MKAEIWEQIRNGDANAMKVLYQDSYQDLYAAALRILPDPDKVKDCLHEIFCEVWQNRENLSQVEHIKAYLKTCVRNRVLREIKLDQNIDAIDEHEEVFQLKEYSYEQLLIESQQLQEDKIRIWDALNKLTPMQREIMSLKFFEGLSYDAIALQLDIKPRTVYNHVYSAISSLRSELK